MADARGSVLIAAISGRALACAAAKAGYQPLVADFFADTDTRACAYACRKVTGAIAEGFQWDLLGPALHELAALAPSPLLGVVYGSGFDDRPALLGKLAESWVVLGNDADTVARIKNPEHFFTTLQRLAIPFPETRSESPKCSTGWLAKRIGGAGGSHVVSSSQQPSRVGMYYQAHLDGPSVSALFVGNGQHATVLGFSEQWTAPAPGRPWRYGGAMQPALLQESVAKHMTDTVDRLSGAFGIKGLASADFIVHGQVPYLLEINPRPGATLDVFADAALFAHHAASILDATLPDHALKLQDASASAVLFAPHRMVVPYSMHWPSWVADVPADGTCIDKQRPVCTVLTKGVTGAHAMQLAESRKASLLYALQCAAPEEHVGGSQTKHENTKPEYPGRTAGARHYR